jgi:hypothetical protein
MPTRIQRRRTAGWRMPEGAVYVGRPTIWGNPWSTVYRDRMWSVVGPDGVIVYRSEGRFDAHDFAVCMYREALRPLVTCTLGPDSNRALADRWDNLTQGHYALWDLRGRNLACWCPERYSCHTNELICAAFNAYWKVGTQVRYWTGERTGEGTLSRTRTDAQVLSGHTPVVWVEGHGACISLTHVEPVGGTS